MPTRWVRFEMKHITALPEYVPCIYALFAGRSLLYIGKSLNIKQRFASYHRYNRLVTHAKARAVDFKLIDYTERRLIRRLKPSMNRQFTGRVRRNGING